MEMNGIAHIQLTVNRFAECVEFYRRLLLYLEMKTIYDNNEVFYCVGSRTGVAITPADSQHSKERFVQRRVGLHHFCFRARQREHIDRLYEFLLEMNATIVHPPQDGPWAEGYYSVLFEDPDGIRIEANHVPGKGNLDPKVELPISRTS